ncbi:hypothetical protein DSECCO2_537920 [anaerobic digester metagenome]
MSCAASACGSDPETGVSSRVTPRLAASVPSVLIQSTDSVELSMAMASGRRPAKAPVSASSQTVAEAASSRTMASTKSAPAAASLGVAACVAPRASIGSAALAVRFHTTT